MLHAIISKSFFSISPSEDLDLDYIQMFERDGRRYLKRLADLESSIGMRWALGSRSPRSKGC